MRRVITRVREGSSVEVVVVVEVDTTEIALLATDDVTIGEDGVRDIKLLGVDDGCLKLERKFGCHLEWTDGNVDGCRCC
ncbi:unnamed protein product [Toxocara canis]|uniref:Uncharacterized protein n=1 Tax=Toxocara canis TaxID=6265 RepID=A0A183UJ01_TOXCA|nr:unnamed protein product [Toxocara canis]